MPLVEDAAAKRAGSHPVSKEVGTEEGTIGEATGGEAKRAATAWEVGLAGARRSTRRRCSSACRHIQSFQIRTQILHRDHPHGSMRHRFHRRRIHRQSNRKQSSSPRPRVEVEVDEEEAVDGRAAEGEAETVRLSCSSDVTCTL